MQQSDNLSTFLEQYAPLKPLDGSALLLHQSTNVFRLWKAQETIEDRVCPPPFWAIAWPANRLLVRYILENPADFRGKSVLDIGCGCGAASIAASRAGARSVTANDIDQMALSVTEINAAANDVIVTTNSTDISKSPPDTAFNIILIADMFYEASVASPLFHHLHNQCRNGATVLIADGNRPFTPRDQLEKITTATFSVDPDVEGVTTRMTTLYRMIKNPL